MVPRLQFIIDQEQCAALPFARDPPMFMLPSMSLCLFRVNVTEDGKKALVTLANGDMRKVLNILQVSAAVTLYA